MRCGGGHNGCEMRWKFFCGRPLIEASVGSAPHCHLTVAERLLCQPLDDIVSIARLLRERLKLAAGIPASADVDKCKHVTVRCEIGGTRVIAIGDVGRERENDRRACRSLLACLWKIK